MYTLKSYFLQLRCTQLPVRGTFLFFLLAAIEKIPQEHECPKRLSWLAVFGKTAIILLLVFGFDHRNEC